MNKINKSLLLIFVVYSLIFQFVTFIFSLLSLDKYTEIIVIIFEVLVPNIVCLCSLVYCIYTLLRNDKFMDSDKKCGNFQ